MTLCPGAVGERRVVDGQLIKVLRSERDALRNADRERGGRALSDGRLDADRALYDVGLSVGLLAGERGRLSARRGRPRDYSTMFHRALDAWARCGASHPSRHPETRATETAATPLPPPPPSLS